MSGQDQAESASSPMQCEEGDKESKHWIIGANYFTEPFQSKYRESTKLEKTQ